MTEQWKLCVDFPHYEVSSLGRVRRVVSVRGRRLGLLRSWVESGYPVIKLRRNGKSVKCYVHRLVGKAFLGLVDDLEIDHRFHDRSDITDICVATSSQNKWNARGQTRGSSRFKGEHIGPITNAMWRPSRSPQSQQTHAVDQAIDGDRTGFGVGDPASISFPSSAIRFVRPIRSSSLLKEAPARLFFFPRPDPVPRFKGVSWSASRRRWYACIKLNGKTRSLGLYENERDAALAYNRAARDAWGDFAFLNELAPYDANADFAGIATNEERVT